MREMRLGQAASECCCHELIQRNARRTPGAAALLWKTGHITFEELNVRANALAGELGRRRVGPESVVGVCGSNCPEMIVTVLAVLKAGGAFLPLDRDCPEERLRHMIWDSGVSVIVTMPGTSGLPELDCDLLSVDGTGAPDDPGNRDDPASGVTPDNAACVLYTSGSTGKPKGVVRLHRAIVDRLHWHPFRGDEIFCHNMPLTVGMSQERLFLPLMLGRPLAIVSDEASRNPRSLATEVDQAGVTDITVVPSVLREMVNIRDREPTAFSTVRSITVGGAPLSRHLAVAFLDAFPDSELINAYGSTESGSVIRGRVAREDHDPVALGAPAGAACAYVLGEGGEPVRTGETGELAVSAPCLARGYLGQPALTAERFVPNPFDGPAGGRLYRTGDRCRLLAGGRIAFAGRADRQVKIRGFRVELEEVEAAILDSPGVDEVAVTTTSPEEPRLVAYVVAKPGVPRDAGALRRDGRNRLPDHMIPSAFVFLDRLPRTANGKIDIVSLPEPGRTRSSLGEAYCPPRNDVESSLAAMWSELLETEPIGVFDDLFELGADSLTGIRLVSRVRDHFGFEVPLDQVFDSRTIAEFAAVLSAHEPH